MIVRRAEFGDVMKLEKFLMAEEPHSRLAEIILDAAVRPGMEYVAALSTYDDGHPESIAAYGIVAGTLSTATLYGVVPITSHTPELLSFAAHDLKQHGAERIIAEFPDTDEFKPYRDVLLESGYDPTGLVEDFYRDGIAMVIFTRKLTA
jgi:hypothetical protein